MLQNNQAFKKSLTKTGGTRGARPLLRISPISSPKYIEKIMLLGEIKKLLRDTSLPHLDDRFYNELYESLRKLTLIDMSLLYNERNNVDFIERTMVLSEDRDVLKYINSLKLLVQELDEEGDLNRARISRDKRRGFFRSPTIKGVEKKFD